jgi:HSP20 family protein
MLTIRGEKKAEHEQKDRDYHLMERSHGTFSRSLPLPFAEGFCGKRRIGS